ncbi:MAG TPA: VWA domain-containing protein [Methanosarcinaceae archaeon]|nr:VWA domain-containing protein [Methanosarcinaceae archaeon]
MTLPLENPQMLWLVVPTLLIGLYLIRKGAKTGIVESRIIVAVLLIIALASPYTLVSKTTIDETPDIVIISDETASMQLFEEGTASRIYEALTAKTPTTLVKVSGDKTSIGDAIVQYSRGDNQIVLVSDGNNNYGKTLEDAFKFAKETGTTVYSVEPELKANDLSVVITGDKTVVIGNKNEFNVVVSQAGEGKIKYSLEVLVDGDIVWGGKNTEYPQTVREKSISLADIKPFMSLGAHTIKVTLTPHGEDGDHINNVFYKSVYVVPKPNIRLIADDTTSSLAKNLFKLYDVSTTGGLSKIDDKKVVVLDNKHINSLSENDVKTLKEYVTDGHGLVVSGGERAYNYGDYLNSSFEELLPVMSKPTDWHGGRSIVLLLDVSESTRTSYVSPPKASDWRHGQIITYEEQQQPSLLSYIFNNAIHIINDPDNRDANIAVISFEKEASDISGGFVYLGIESNRNEIIKNIIEFEGAGDTNLSEGLIMAEDVLEQSAGSQNIVILSDGGIERNYGNTVEVAKRLHNKGINLFFVHHTLLDTFSSYPEKLMTEIGQPQNYVLSKESNINIIFEELEKPPEDDNTILHIFPLIEYNSNHFITRNIEIAGNITGYNDVTPKAGADRLIITTTGKPVLTTWRYGLGRVASLTTDNGEGGGNRWSSQMYAGNNSKLTSAILNWAIGNPRIEEGAVLEGMDTWLGTPVTLTLVMYDEGVLPALKLDGTGSLELSVTGENTYETTIDPDRIGMHDISGYPVAVNYALEYRDVGLNEDMPSFIISSGGKTYNERYARALLLEDAKKNSERVVQEPVSWKMYFVIAALLLFLLEIVIRRIKEIQAAKRAERMGV